MNPNVNYGLWVTIGSSILTIVPLWWGVLMMGEVVHVWDTKKKEKKNLCTFYSLCCEPKTAFKNKSICKKKLRPALSL